jgi:hypothetical protein
MISSPERILPQVLKAVLGRIKVNWSINLWTVQFLLNDITTFNIGFPIPYTLQKPQVLTSIQWPQDLVVLLMLIFKQR